MGKSKKHPFSASNRLSNFVLELVHTELWTSLIPSLSGYKSFLWMIFLGIPGFILFTTGIISFHFFFRSTISLSIYQIYLSIRHIC